MTQARLLPGDPQLSLWADAERRFRPVPPYRATRSLMAHPSRLRILRMVSYVLRFFPELRGQTVEVGITKGAEGRAVVGDPRIWLNPRGLSYQTIAHELVHVLQGQFGIPSGERSCDLFAVARDHTLVDIRPAYLKIPGSAFDESRRPFPGVAPVLTTTAREAIEKRRLGHRQYISWFEGEVSRRLIMTTLRTSGYRQSAKDGVRRTIRHMGRSRSLFTHCAAESSSQRNAHDLT